MTTTITREPSAGEIIPDLVVGFSASRTAQNVVHQILGRREPDVTLRPAGPRSGTLTLLFTSKAAAFACERAHIESGIFILVDDEIPDINMSYVPSGAITITLDPETLTIWTVTVEYQALSAPAAESTSDGTTTSIGIYGAGIYGAG